MVKINKLSVILGTIILAGCNHGGSNEVSPGNPSPQGAQRSNVSAVTPLNGSADAESVVYQVGPGKKYTSLKQVASLLQAGDVVYVDGNATYTGSVAFENNGTADKPIRIIGVAINGKRPVISADLKSSTNLVTFYGDHYFFENFEVVGNMSKVAKAQMTGRGINQISNYLTISHCIVHDARNGIMASDQFSGNLTIEYSEIYANGYSDGEHNIYIASDRVRNPDSVTRIMFNYIHDSLKGAGLKTRTSRNEIYYNRFENNAQSEVDMYGADLGAGSDPILDNSGNIIGYSSDNHVTQDELRKIDPGYGENYLREDTDFVGNLVISNNKVKSLTIGGDGGSGGPTRNGTSFGRYRFVNNTFINNYLPPAGDDRIYTAQVKFGVGSLEFYNNIFYNANGSNMVLYFNPYDASNDKHNTNSDLRWSNGRQFVASNNWFKTGSKIPDEFHNNILGSIPDFTDTVNYQLHQGSPLSSAGTKDTVFNFPLAIYYSNINGLHEDKVFINPLALPQYTPIGKNTDNTPQSITLTSTIPLGAL